uniref:Uncharacterized protein n=1 Tax=Phaeomonas parva TaxID=124430 RepID=A0A7S1TRG1_9STRA|mmetsp:Transcript_14460/g.43433  ORF Transcript_14460/g.43433 Transcript_14460/m.43433 type:complete len:341 (+) Transcript_14460:420-1442(+)
MSAGLYDLKLKKRLLKQQLEVLDVREARINEIKMKRTQQRSSPQGGRGSPARLKPLDLEARRSRLLQRRQEAGQTAALRDFNRMKPQASSSLAVYTMAPAPILPGGNMDRIRKRDAVRRTKLRLQGEAVRRERANRKPPKPKRVDMKLTEPLFVGRYTRGELPATLEHRTNGYGLSWVCPLQSLDYEYYLPIFFEGIRCQRDPYRFLARQGVLELLDASRGYPERVLPYLESIVVPLRDAVVTHDEDVLIAVLMILQKLVTCNPGVGEAIVPYYRQFLAAFKRHYSHGENLGDGMDYKQRKGITDICTMTAETLQLLQKTGGPDAYANIKWLIPTYESCL